MRKQWAIFLTVISFLLAYSPLAAHEYWIEPLDFTPPIDGTVSADLKVGSDFKSNGISYLQIFTTGYQVTDQNGTRELKGLTGDRPALTFTPEAPGLTIMTYQTTQNRVNFSVWEIFETYLIKQGMPDIIGRHRARGLPETGFTEFYSRYVKSLLAVGEETGGEDRAIGMRVELVALTNPYQLSPEDNFPVQLLSEGAPLADTQISVFARSQKPGEEEILDHSTVRTDENGRAVITVTPGHRYLLNAIEMVEVKNQGAIVWESFWASLTFEVPE